jgi:hypothetical protein
LIRTEVAQAERVSGENRSKRLAMERAERWHTVVEICRRSVACFRPSENMGHGYIRVTSGHRGGMTPAFRLKVGHDHEFAGGRCLCWCFKSNSRRHVWARCDTHLTLIFTLNDFYLRKELSYAEQHRARTLLISDWKHVRKG